MPPHYELNDRFKAHIRRSKQLRLFSITAVTTGLFLCGGYALAGTNTGSALSAIGRTSASIVAQSAGAASAGTMSLVDRLGHFISKISPSPTPPPNETPVENGGQPAPADAGAAAPPT